MIYWVVKIKAPYFMTGLHRFKTKRDALDFRNKWVESNPGVSFTPEVEKEYTPSSRVEKSVKKILGE